MNITFLIGNGFDRGCGLNSCFSDTYDEYIKEKSSSPEVKHFKNTIKKDIERWSDFEMKLAEYAHSVKNEDELLECIRDYTRFLRRYLKKEEKVFIQKYQNYSVMMKDAVCKQMVDSLLYFYRGTTKNEEYMIENMIQSSNERVYTYISFNYTNVFEYMVEKMHYYRMQNNIFVPRFETGIHIHGVLDEDMVLGIDNEGQLDKLHYPLSRLGKRTLIKPIFVQEFDNKRVLDAKKMIEDSSIICIFGMAMGDSDMTWRDEISKWLFTDKNHHLYYYYHEAMKQTDMLYYDRIEYSENKRWDILHMLHLEDNEHIQEQIHIPVGNMLFNPANIKITEIRGADVESVFHAMP